MNEFVVSNKPVGVKSGMTDVKLIKGGNGTSLQGYINARYEDIVKILGPQNGEGGGYKVGTEWCIQFKEPDGTRTVATIYDWKEEGLRCRRGSYEWHIGGFNKHAVKLVEQLLAA